MNILKRTLFIIASCVLVSFNHTYAQIIWQQNGTNIFYNNGNVGIGTTTPNPNFKLDVNGSINAGFANFNGLTTINIETSDIMLTVDGTKTIHTEIGDNLLLNPNGGNVGIGTSNPNYKLEVNGNFRATSSEFQSLYTNNFETQSIMLIGQSPSSIWTEEGNDILLNPNAGNIGIGLSANTPTAKLDVGGDINISAGSTYRIGGQPIVFSQWLTGASNTINYNAGNIGVGTSTPNNKLEINYGTAGNSGLRFTQLTSSSTTSTGNGKFLSVNSAGDVILTDAGAIAYRWSSTGNGGTNPSNNFIGTVDNQDFAIRTNLIERLRVKSNGNVGIGTTTANNKLEINQGTAGNSGLRFTQLNSSSTAVTGNGKFLSLNSTGDVILTDAGSLVSTWSLLGNAVADPSINFIGTTNAQDLVFRTNNYERLRIKSDGSVGIGTIPSQTLTLMNSFGDDRTTIRMIEPIGDSYWDLTILPSLGDFQLSNGIKTPFFIKNETGNIGINTLTPNNNLEIKQGTDGNSGLRFTNLKSTSTTTSGNGKYLSVNASGDVILVDGVSSSPAWNISGNSGTNPTTNFIGTIDNQDFAIKTNNTEKIRVKSNGYLGIGTIVPNNKVEINHGTAGNSGLRFTQLTSSSATSASNGKVLSVNTTGDVILTDAGNASWSLSGNTGINLANNFIGTRDLQDFIIRTNNFERLTVTKYGSVGIGISNPHHTFQVSGGAFFSVGESFEAFVLQNGPSGYNAIRYDGEQNILFLQESGGNVGIGTTSPNGLLSLKENNQELNFHSNKKLMGSWPPVAENNTFTIQSSGANAGNIAFATGNSEIMRIASTGYVGIGTTNPQSVFEINRSINDFWTARIKNGGGSSKGLLLEVGYGGDNVSTIMQLADANGNTRATFKSNGNVGIGVTNPQYKLTVAGTIAAREINVTTEIWSDFVFHSSYKLRSLGEVEQFIKTNSHLPEIPSEKEVKKNGISVGEMNVKLLQKIEELTLYMIEQQKQITSLQNQVNEMKQNSNK